MYYYHTELSEHNSFCPTCGLPALVQPGSPEDRHAESSTFPCPTEKFRLRVASGIKWLDRFRPEWYKQIDLDLLDMGSGNFCVLGQLKVAFTEVPQPFSLAHFGFNVYSSSDEDCFGGYTILYHLWKEAITKRKEEGVTV